MTLEEYQRTPETVLPQELIYGAMRVADAPFVSHQRVVFRIARALDDHAHQHGLGEVLVAPVDVILDAQAPLVVQPDVIYVSRDRAALVTNRVLGAPDLAIEVLSPWPRIGQLDERLAWFARYGVREVWLYHQTVKRLDVLDCRDGQVAARTSYESGQRLHSRVLPLFDRSVASMLRD